MSVCDFAGFAKVCFYSSLQLTLVATTKAYYPLLLHAIEFLPFFCYKRWLLLLLFVAEYPFTTERLLLAHAEQAHLPPNSTDRELSSGTCPSRGSRCPSKRQALLLASPPRAVASTLLLRLSRGHAAAFCAIGHRVQTCSAVRGRQL